MVGKARAHLKLNLIRDMNGNKNYFYSYSSSERQTGKSVGQILNGERHLEQNKLG